MNIGADQIAIIHGGRTLFSNVSFQVSPGDKIGLIGKNGAGKSSLLKLLAGTSDPDEGSISRPKDLLIGYLPQEMPLPEGKSVLEEASTAFAELLAKDAELNKINEELSRRDDHESKDYHDLIHQQVELTEQLNLLGWHDISMKVEKVLLGLGFKREELDRNTGEFSGGWRMRIELAKILLKDPDLLLLDEPTNHLDIESIQWLEGFLSDMNVSIILISHDIAFLNKITNRTIEISNSRIYDYPLPYSKYLERRKEVRETLMASQKNQQKKIKDTEAFINRFRAKNTKASQVQSRIKMLDRMDIIEVEEDEVSSMRIRFPEAPRSGKVNLEVKNASKSYGEKKVLENIEFLLARGEKIAFVGQNGAGKTTLSKMIVGETDYTGQINLGHQVEMGYYAQDQSDTMNPNLDVFSVVANEGREITQNEIRTLLGAFLFSGDDQYKKVKVLSGGEKARLALCRLLLKPVNFLVLDEPTNHLDIQSKKILKEALTDYKGSMIIVSHDREFLSGLTDKVYEFKDGGIKEYVGDIDEYLSSRKLEDIDELAIREKSPKRTEEKKSASVKENKLKKEKQKEERRLRSKIEKLEKEIEELEIQLKELSEKISNSEEYSAASITEYQQLNQKLDRHIQAWERMNIELEDFS